MELSCVAFHYYLYSIHKKNEEYKFETLINSFISFPTAFCDQPNKVKYTTGLILSYICSGVNSVKRAAVIYLLDMVFLLIVLKALYEPVT